MENNTDEKLGRVIVDGKIVDLDTASLEELNEYLSKINKEEVAIQSKIDEILDLNNKLDKDAATFAKIRQSCLMDDAYMAKFFDRNIKCT